MAARGLYLRTFRFAGNVFPGVGSKNKERGNLKCLLAWGVVHRRGRRTGGRAGCGGGGIGERGVRCGEQLA